MAAPSPFHVAIVGGGLCGLSLALALKHRQIPFTVYEARSSFSEIGAGINLGPNGLRALRAIDPSLGEAVYTLATRNLPPEEDTWMWFRYGAASGAHEDGETAFKLFAPQTGSLTLHRREFLAALAEKIGDQNTEFDKKLISYAQDERGVTLEFSDGTQKQASVLVGCDGIHSRVRATMLGVDNPTSKPYFNGDGAFRAVIPIEKAVEAWGESGRQSQVVFGPNGYLMYYPVSKGSAVNCGIWIPKTESWDKEEWLAREQDDQFRDHMKDWGPRVHRLLEHFEHRPAFWALYQHMRQPESFADGRVILIGDGAHAMPPHQGAGASQAAEDAYVLARALESMVQRSHSLESVVASLRAVDEIRRPRLRMVQQLSTDSGPLWYAFFNQKLEGDEREAWFARVKERFDLIWGVDVGAEAERAILRIQEMLGTN